jgi:hypothetical protein
MKDAMKWDQVPSFVETGSDMQKFTRRIRRYTDILEIA